LERENTRNDGEKRQGFCTGIGSLGHWKITVPEGYWKDVEGRGNWTKFWLSLEGDLGEGVLLWITQESRSPKKGKKRTNQTRQKRPQNGVLSLATREQEGKRQREKKGKDCSRWSVQAKLETGCGRVN